MLGVSKSYELFLKDSQTDPAVLLAYALYKQEKTLFISGVIQDTERSLYAKNKAIDRFVEKHTDEVYINKYKEMAAGALELYREDNSLKEIRLLTEALGRKVAEGNGKTFTEFTNDFEKKIPEIVKASKPDNWRNSLTKIGLGLLTNLLFTIGVIFLGVIFSPDFKDLVIQGGRKMLGIEENARTSKPDPQNQYPVDTAIQRGK